MIVPPANLLQASVMPTVYNPPRVVVNRATPFFSRNVSYPTSQPVLHIVSRSRQASSLFTLFPVAGTSAFVGLAVIISRVRQIFWVTPTYVISRLIETLGAVGDVLSATTRRPHHLGGRVLLPAKPCQRGCKEEAGAPGMTGGG